MEKEWINYWNALKEVENDKKEENKKQSDIDKLAEEIYVQLLDNNK